MSELQIGKPTMWRYRAGEWSKVPDPIAEVPGDDYDYNYQEALKAIGFGVCSFNWGYPSSTVEIYEHNTEREHWRVDVCFDCTYIHTIEVSQLPDLLDVLAKLAPAVTADVLSHVAQHPRDVLAAEQRRKRPKR
jgi:hypothetical protein